VHNQSIQDFVVTAACKFDLLVSNPPFFIDAFTSANSERNTARHNHTLNQHDLWKVVTDLSHQNSLFSIILPITEGDLFLIKGKEYPWYLSKKCVVKGTADANEKRVLLEFSRVKTNVENYQLVIEKQRGIYTEEFTALVKDFYLHL